MVIILGLGFTGQRLAWRLLVKGIPVYAAVRDFERFGRLAAAGLTLSELSPDNAGALPKHAILVHLVPPVAWLRAFIEQIEPRRIVYVSSTGVYGDQIDVGAETPAQPNDERGRARLEEERWIAAGPWTSLILRSAAIYGPGRGVHVAIRAGKIPRGGASGVVSRIHVDDLAAIIEAGALSGVTGAWPVADDAACPTLEIVAWCARILNLDAIPPMGNDPAVAGRRVDGTKIREELKIELMYPSWRTGIPASLQEEDEQRG